MNIKIELNNAHAELEVAKRFQQRLEAAKSIEDYEDFWKSLLDSLIKTRNKIYNSCKSHPQYHGWKSIWSKQANNIPMVDYVQHARDADNHTISPTTQMTPGQLMITAGDKTCHIKGIDNGPNGFIIEYSGGTPNISFSPEKILLLPALVRGTIYPPPKESNYTAPHLLVVPVIDFYENMLKSATELFITEKKHVHEFPNEGTIYLELVIPDLWPVSCKTNITSFEESGVSVILYALPSKMFYCQLSNNNGTLNECYFTTNVNKGDIIKLGISWKEKELSIACNGEIVFSDRSEQQNEHLNSSDPLFIVSKK